MKKLIFIFVASVMMACSSEESREIRCDSRTFDRALSAFVEKQKLSFLLDETRSSDAEKSVDGLLARGGGKCWMTKWRILLHQMRE